MLLYFQKKKKIPLSSVSTGKQNTNYNNKNDCKKKKKIILNTKLEFNFYKEFSS